MEEEMGEMPLKIRNVKLMLYYKYWVHLQGNILWNSSGIKWNNVCFTVGERK